MGDVVLWQGYVWSNSMAGYGWYSPIGRGWCSSMASDVGSGVKGQGNGLCVCGFSSGATNFRHPQAELEIQSISIFS